MAARCHLFRAHFHVSGIMPAMLLRQSLKIIMLGYSLCLAAEVAIAAYWLAASPNIPFWAPMLVPAVLALFVAIRHIRRRFRAKYFRC